MIREASPISSKLQIRSSSNRHKRLYDLSIKKQQEGRIRREDIGKSLPKLQLSPIPKHLQVYEEAGKTKKMIREASPISSKLQIRSSSNRHKRLYDLSIKKQQEGRARREDIGKSLPKPQSSSIPKHLQVCEEAGKTKKMMRDASLISSKLQAQSSSAQKKSSLAPNNRHNRLYELSKKKQQQGRALRKDIIKSKQNVSALNMKSQNTPSAEELFKRKRNPTPSKFLDSKVLDKQACRLYQRGMQSIISLERKRVVAAYTSDIGPYKSPLLECTRV